MKLKTLLKSIAMPIDVRGNKDIEITGMTSHSQAAAPGYLFVAKRGEKYDGNQYASDVMLAGAYAILSDMYNPSLKNITQVIVTDVLQAEALLASQLYGHAADSLYMVGVTGTSGKTTTSYIIRHLLRFSGVPAGLIGTVSYITGSSIIQASRTTPDVVLTHKLLKDMIKEGEKACVMEVSSHALDQRRVAEIDFDVAVFTNISHEHLDYHKTMEKYVEAKRKLFERLGAKKSAVAVMNRQDPYFFYMKNGCSKPIYTYGIEDRDADLSAWNIELSSKESRFDLSYKGLNYPIRCPLLGRFNIMNILAASAVLLSRNTHIEQIIEGLKTFQAPPGRLEPIQNSLSLSIFVDYAHKEDALRNVLSTLRECTKGKIITVFGCGGDRDRQKRPKMGRAVEQLGDFAIITSDNPRSENPNRIIQEITDGCQDTRYSIELNRKKAIEQAISMATPDDVILIAGKGHEKEQVFHYHTIPFDDCHVAYEFCKKLYALRKK